MDWTQKTVLVTDGTGSFGKQFTTTVLRECQPRKLIIFSRDELKKHEMRVGGFYDTRLRFLIGDVGDADRLRRAMTGVGLVVHAAEFKRAPAYKHNLLEAVKATIDGAANVNLRSDRFFTLGVEP